jgi:hypothetical protein
MKFTVTERYTKSYEIEADSFDDAREKAMEGDIEGEFTYEELAFITSEDGKNTQFYS